MPTPSMPKTIEQIMSSPAITVKPQTRIREIARIMREHQISGVPVVDESDRPLGVVTEIDLIERHAPVKPPQYLAILSGLIPVSLEEYRRYKEQVRHILAINAEQLMSTQVETIGPGASVEEALERMLDPAVFLLAVVQEERVIGVVTRTDLVRLIEELELVDEEGTEAAG